MKEFSKGVKRPVREADPPTPPNDGVKSEWS
jgi:hypothetical protein